ncbi:MAG: hypothetical protein PHR35_11015 [Kiritimatiellae bacterium]|nr:hypothetical protein [Kiritimatiellia bacterium]
MNAYVTVRSVAENRCVMVNPWPGERVVVGERRTGGTVLRSAARVIRFDSRRAGESG